ncbi:hypothetical protein B0A65_22380 [Flavobacterium frigidimaris]|uniref:DNA mimic protein DMP19 C-terminal domain-containing protein n=2 Tax=Flavobacterium frigidimaris TaxID=262320 RepID=A0ABX4BJZ4_FLAFR|nr:hypothetical protein B0A65_22380 [Flavobacterium frigidimaris]
MKIEKETIGKIKTQKTLPHIKKEELINYYDNTWDLFFLLLSKYYEIMDTVAEDNFTDSQHTLMAYNILYGEITTGGFLQLIKNGHGNYIFESLFSETLKKWGAIEMAVQIDKAKKIYFENKEELEIARTTEDLFDMYPNYPEFNFLDKEFFRVMNSESDKIKIYIQQNIHDFAIVA